MKKVIKKRSFILKRSIILLSPLFLEPIVFGDEVLFESKRVETEVPKVQEVNAPFVSEDVKEVVPENYSAKKKKGTLRRNTNSRTNLPHELRSRNLNLVQVSSDVVIQSKSKNPTDQMELGDKYYSKISSSIIAFPNESPTVRAVVLSGKLDGSIFLGEATLEPNSKRILIKFKKVKLRDGQVFGIEGEALSLTGEPWFMGKHYSKEVQYFTADFLSSMASAYFDGRIERTTNIFGNVQEVPSVDAAANKGLAAGSKELANRFREKLKSSPEFSILQGPIELEILITDQAKILK